MWPSQNIRTLKGQLQIHITDLINWLLIEKLGLTCCLSEIRSVVCSKGFVSSLEVDGGSYLADLRLCLGVFEDSMMVGLKLFEEKSLNCFQTEFLFLQKISTYFFTGSATLHIRAPLKTVYFDDVTIFETYTKLYEVPIISSSYFNFPKQLFFPYFRVKQKSRQD